MTFFRSRYQFTFYLLLLVYTNIYSQQGNIWYFGEFAGLNFNTIPPTALTNGQLNTAEGCTSISDKNGAVLFYTDGVTVYDRSHNVMPNGNGLMGDQSAMNAAIIVPKPGDPNIYYIFAADSEGNSYIKGYTYSEVDMRLHNGLGDVTAQKNIPLYAPCSERLTAVKHANGIDYWVLTKGFGNNTFAVYKVDCAGVNTIPVISNTGVTQTGQYSGVGCMKASPDGKKLSLTINGSNAMGQLFDFNNTTGIISYPIDLTGYDPFSIYGVEFSPDSRLLYISSTTNWINQYDITSNDQTIINASAYRIITAAGDDNLALQLGPDQKLYSATISETSLNVINNPNVYGPGCNLINAGVNLNGRRCRSGLPVYISSYFDANNRVDFTSVFVDCHVQFTGTTNIASTLQWFWDFGDGTTGAGQVINHSYRQVGTYNVTLKGVPFSGSCLSNDTFYVTHPITINNVFAVDFTKTGNCFGDNYQFLDNTILTIGTITGYSWDFGDGSPVVNTQNTSHTYAAAGVYDVKLVISTSGICRADSIIKKVYVDTRPNAAFTLVDGCVNLPIAFTDVSTNTVGGVGAWNWNFGDGGTSTLQNPTHAYSTPGPYSAILTVESAHGCPSAQVSNSLRIYDLPVADYTFTIPCIGQGTVFTDLSPTTNGNIIAWQWNFGDGGNASAQNPIHTYNSTGSFPASLQVQSQYGCLSAPKIIPVNISRATAFAGRDTTATFDVPLQLQASGGITYEWIPATGLNNPFIANPTATLRNDITYTVTVTDFNGCTASDDVFVKVYANIDVWVPGSFTPNGDGLNDILKPLGFGLKKIEYFMIYNRYGELVFETHELDKGWDGTFKGKPQPVGTYSFMVKAINYKDRAVAKTGTTILIR